MTYLSAYMYTDKTPKKHGGGGYCPPIFAYLHSNTAISFNILLVYTSDTLSVEVTCLSAYMYRQNSEKA